ncbi:hypothetical protein M0813_12039 [Anaeramoeba flamelloides]|uniref:DDE-1 domain-containing protein n=1 Tax=Anaeramoeba flamelloides TaxID=1746091 RepID=A0ABQ8ZCZ3_9EUKA|nr:hypothetical protein M0813_12039 [Anaeramoeba flamelloides]
MDEKNCDYNACPKQTLVPRTYLKDQIKSVKAFKEHFFENITLTKPVQIQPKKVVSDTIVACIRADGARIPPMIIENRQGYISRTSNICNRQKIGGMNQTFMLDWLNYFKQFVKMNDILILDNLGSHTCKSTKKRAKELNIHLVFLPVGQAIKYSPLDNRFFGNFETEFKTKCTQVLYFSRLWKNRVLSHCYYTVKSSAIINFFKSCEIIPKPFITENVIPVKELEEFTITGKYNNRTEDFIYKGIKRDNHRGFVSYFLKKIVFTDLEFVSIINNSKKPDQNSKYTLSQPCRPNKDGILQLQNIHQKYSNTSTIPLFSSIKKKIKKNEKIEICDDDDDDDDDDDSDSDFSKNNFLIFDKTRDLNHSNNNLVFDLNRQSKIVSKQFEEYNNQVISKQHNYDENTVNPFGFLNNNQKMITKKNNIFENIEKIQEFEGTPAIHNLSNTNDLNLRQSIVSRNQENYLKVSNALEPISDNYFIDINKKKSKNKRERKDNR